ncbi:hypothetical protein [Umezawaea sp. Da 62-37]|uniref:hypothetical protein n=1 Tax=Umezawaea sp. Da 62-37 TaxID=3075927 RepID=UPI0028F7282C|nr:hypothetical protein [Umezawaea sp. Da 62-37]WNV83260.1 hypothetical protein RM788_34475 [Umezawaea sp. Da 62-37]
MALRAITAAFTGLLLLAACASTDPLADPHAGHHPATSTTIYPAGPFTTLDEVVRWTRAASGQCADAKAATMPEFASYLGADRARLYEPFVAEWATCSVPPFSKVGLVLFKPDGVRALQESWKRGLADGTLTENPDFGFGDGFALTSEELGTGELGLRHLWCRPVAGTDAEQEPAGVDGCVFARTEDHH